MVWSENRTMTQLTGNRSQTMFEVLVPIVISLPVVEARNDGGIRHSRLGCILISKKKWWFVVVVVVVADMGRGTVLLFSSSSSPSSSSLFLWLRAVTTVANRAWMDSYMSGVVRSMRNRSSEIASWRCIHVDMNDDGWFAEEEEEYSFTLEGFSWVAEWLVSLLASIGTISAATETSKWIGDKSLVLYSGRYSNDRPFRFAYCEYLGRALCNSIDTGYGGNNIFFFVVGATPFFLDDGVFIRPELFIAFPHVEIWTPCSIGSMQQPELLLTMTGCTNYRSAVVP